MLKEDQYTEVCEDVVKYFKKIEKDFAFPMDFKYLFQNNTKQKKLITIKKIPDNYAVLLQSEIIVTVNDDIFDLIDDESKCILFEQEIDKINYDLNKGTFKLAQPTMKTSLGIVNKFTYEKVERAHEIEKELLKKKEKDEEVETENK